MAPRFGTAYDLTGHQNIILRGGAGLFFDRPAGNSIYAQVQNPPTVRNVTLRYSNLQSLTSGLATEAAPTLTVYQYESGLPSTWQWNGGVQLALPLDVSRPEAVERLRSELERVLGDVRAAVEDWPAMVVRGRAVAADLGENPPPVDPEELAVFMPEPGGPSLDEVEQLLARVRDSGKLVGVGFTGLAPDPGNVDKLERLTAALGY